MKTEIPSSSSLEPAPHEILGGCAFTGALFIEAGWKSIPLPIRILVLAIIADKTLKYFSQEISS